MANQTEILGHRLDVDKDINKALKQWRAIIGHVIYICWPTTATRNLSTYRIKYRQNLKGAITVLIL